MFIDVLVMLYYYSARDRAFPSRREGVYCIEILFTS